MSARNSMRRSAAIVVGGLIVVAPVGCSSSESRDEAAPNPARIVVEGQTRTVDGTTVCMDGPTGEVSIELDPPGTAPGATSPNPIVVLDLTPQGATPSVSLLAINLPDVALSAGRYLDLRSADGDEGGEHVHGQSAGHSGRNAARATGVQVVRARNHLPLGGQA